MLTGQDAEAELSSARRELRKAELAAQEKDRELAVVLQRMAAYEQGVYGLRDAVKEIKGLKQQVCFMYIIKCIHWVWGAMSRCVGCTHFMFRMPLTRVRL